MKRGEKGSRRGTNSQNLHNGYSLDFFLLKNYVPSKWLLYMYLYSNNGYPFKKIICALVSFCEI